MNAADVPRITDGPWPDWATIRDLPWQDRAEAVQARVRLVTALEAERHQRIPIRDTGARVRALAGLILAALPPETPDAIKARRDALCAEISAYEHRRTTRNAAA